MASSTANTFATVKAGEVLDYPCEADWMARSVATLRSRLCALCAWEALSVSKLTMAEDATLSATERLGKIETFPVDSETVCRGFDQ